MNETGNWVSIKRTDGCSMAQWTRDFSKLFLQCNYPPSKKCLLDTSPNWKSQTFLWRYIPQIGCGLDFCRAGDSFDRIVSSYGKQFHVPWQFTYNWNRSKMAADTLSNNADPVLLKVLMNTLKGHYVSRYFQCWCSSNLYRLWSDRYAAINWWIVCHHSESVFYGDLPCPVSFLRP